MFYSWPPEMVAIFIMPKKVRIFVENGEMKYLYSENGMDLRGIDDNHQINRVSDVEYNHETKEWEATLKDGSLIASDTSRDAVLEKERLYIEDKLSRREHIPI